MAFLLTGCLYHFAGGGLPPHIKTVAVLPFDNETPQPTLQRELYDLMRRDVENRLGLREATEGKADAVVRGKILRYDPDIPAHIPRIGTRWPRPPNESCRSPSMSRSSTRRQVARCGRERGCSRRERMRSALRRTDGARRSPRS